MIYLLSSPTYDVYGGNPTLSKADFLKAEVTKLGFKPNRVYVSPKKCPRQVSQILFGETGTPLVEFDDIYYGTLEGTERDMEIDTMLEEEPFSLYAYEGDDVYIRRDICVKTLNLLKKAYHGRIAVIVTHKAIIQMLVKNPFVGEIGTFEVVRWK